jgi:catechol 2,3-dioxygenase-like lactoylglutathione lyase family enzyme
MKQPGLALVILAVEDVARSVAFYRGATGWTVAVETPVYVELTAPNGLRLGIYERSSFGKNINRVPERVAGPVATTELYLVVDDAVEPYLVRALELGATLLDEAADRGWGHRVGYVADPDGNVVAFALERVTP